MLDLARKALADGIELGGKNFSVEILDQDTQSDPSRAGQLAKDLINNQAIDLMLAVSTPETINPVADACEAAGVPCLSTVMPWEAWYFGRGAKPGEPSPFKWTYHFGFGVDEFFKTYISQWKLIETNKKVGVMYPNDADGNAIRANLAPLLAKEGFTIVDPGAYETGTTDYSSQIAMFKQEGVEIFNSFPIPPDFAAFWRQAAQQGLTKQIKIAQIAKTGLFPSDIEALGDLGKNIASAAYWHKAFPYKSTLTGVSGTELADGYEAASGKQWTQQLGATMSLLDAGFAALKASSDAKSKEAVAKALSTLKTDDDDRQGRLHQRAGGQCLARADHRHAMGAGQGRQQVQVRLCGDRERHRSQCAGRGQARCPTTPEPTSSEDRFVECTCRTARSSPQRRSTSASARLWCSTTSTCRCARTRRSASSAPTAPARRRCSACSPARFRRAPARSTSAAPTSRRCSAAQRCRLGLVRTHQVPKPFSGMTAFENVFVAAAHGAGLSRDEAYDERHRFARAVRHDRRSPTGPPRRSACSTASGWSWRARWRPSRRCCCSTRSAAG